MATPQTTETISEYIKAISERGSTIDSTYEKVRAAYANSESASRATISRGNSLSDLSDRINTAKSHYNQMSSTSESRNNEIEQLQEKISTASSSKSRISDATDSRADPINHLGSTINSELDSSNAISEEKNNRAGFILQLQEAVIQAQSGSGTTRTSVSSWQDGIDVVSSYLEQYQTIISSLKNNTNTFSGNLDNLELNVDKKKSTFEQTAEAIQNYIQQVQEAEERIKTINQIRLSRLKESIRNRKNEINKLMNHATTV